MGRHFLALRKLHYEALGTRLCVRNMQSCDKDKTLQMHTYIYNASTVIYACTNLAYELGGLTNE